MNLPVSIDLVQSPHAEFDAESEFIRYFRALALFVVVFSCGHQQHREKNSCLDWGSQFSIVSIRTRRSLIIRRHKANLLRLPVPIVVPEVSIEKQSLR